MKSLLTLALALLPVFAFAADPVPGENNSKSSVWKPPVAPAGMTAIPAIPATATTVQGCANGKCDLPQADTRWKPFGGAFRLFK